MDEPLLDDDDKNVGSGESSSDPKSDADGGWRACRFIIGTEFCERLSYVGIYINLVVFLTTRMHQGNASAAASVTTWSGTCYLTSFIGAFLADSYWGRYWTIGLVSIVYVIGMVLLTFAASLPSLMPPPCALDNVEECPDATPLQNVLLYTALYLIAFGTGGIKPCVSAFGADQFDSGHPVESLQMASFFNWFYMSVNVGALLASSVLVYVQGDLGWGLGYGLSTLLMLAAIVTFFSGTTLYRRQKPGGSPLTRILQVLVAALSKRNIEAPRDKRLLFELPECSIEGSRKLHHRNSLRFLDKAATRTWSDNEDQQTPWRLCTVTQVEEVKTVVRILPIWAGTILFFTVYAQMTTLFIEQGLRMDSRVGKSFKLAPASFLTVNTLTAIAFIPLYDWYLAPLLSKLSGYKQGLAQMNRMAIGLLISTIAMLVAAGVEERRLQLAAMFNLLDNATDPSPMSILWQTPQYAILGIAEVFTVVGQLQFFYDQSPDAMRSLGSALALSTAALGNYLSSFLVSVCKSWIPDNLNRGHLDYFFLLMALLSACNQAFFWLCSRGYKAKASSSEQACDL